MRHSIACSVTWISLAILLLPSNGPSLIAAEPLQFNRDIRPILTTACFNCHGQAKQKASLRLDTPEAAYAVNKKSDVAAIVPKKPAASEAIRRIFATDEAEIMPPPDSHKKLTAEQKAILKRWVEEGAVYEPHWAFQPIRKPAVPQVPGNTSTNPIDAFVSYKLAQLKLTANPEADRPTLIRRVSFAVTGLPPTIAQVDQFLADKADGAYGRMVDRFLASPQYGEEMARHWLDLARYADTHGLHLDNERGIWPYRDWVVRAFNENKRFDTFTIEQLAGDLLPNATKDQLVATGFNRCNVSTGEGGSIDAEWTYRYAVDRATVAVETWLGLTAGCTQCHDHKFDPITMKDFYSLYAFFYSIDGSPMDRNALYHQPAVKLSTPEQDKKLKGFDQQIRSIDAAINTATARYVDMGLVAAITGSAAIPDANDPAHSFVAWVNQRQKLDQAKLPKEIATIITNTSKPGQKPNAAQYKQLHAYYLRSVCVETDAVLDPLYKSKDTVTAERNKFDQSIPSSMIFREAATPRQAFVMSRGQYDKPAEKVEPNTPAAFPPIGGKGRHTRLDLARWMVRADNPLTARVYVNRLWQQFFGIGIVKTTSDFGLQGETPVDPELLDWLASNFRDTGWDIRATVRLILTSYTFRRTSTLTPELAKADLENRYNARGPRFRLEAEQIRDNALFVSGLMDMTIGGHGVKPYQPANIWEPVGYTDSNTRFYKQDSGSALYRRTLYTFFKRTAPPPYLQNFDAPNREQSCGRRDRSNTPLQALQLLNDTQHVEAARVLAERILTEGGKTDEARIRFAFRVVLTRQPTTQEMSILQTELSTLRTRYQKAPADAEKVIKVGESKLHAGLKPEEVAAYTLLASTLLNLDETICQN